MFLTVYVFKRFHLSQITQTLSYPRSHVFNQLEPCSNSVKVSIEYHMFWASFIMTGHSMWLLLVFTWFPYSHIWETANHRNHLAVKFLAWTKPLPKWTDTSFNKKDFMPLYEQMYPNRLLRIFRKQNYFQNRPRYHCSKSSSKILG